MTAKDNLILKARKVTDPFKNDGKLSNAQLGRFKQLYEDTAILAQSVTITCMLCQRDCTSRFRQFIHWFFCWKKREPADRRFTIRTKAPPRDENVEKFMRRIERDTKPS